MASARMAERIAAVRARRTMAPAPAAGTKTKTMALASTGAPVVAIVWKNALALRRTFQGAGLLRLLSIVVIAGGTMFSMHSSDGAHAIARIAAVMVILVPTFVLQAVRNDMRTDMLHLPLLKSIPLSGSDLVLAEVMSSTLPVAAVQLTLVAITGIAWAFSPDAIPVPPAVRAGVLLTSPLIAIAVNGAICTMLNGTAILFPAWIRLGPAGAGGIEVAGQSIISMAGTIIAFALLLVIPLAAGAAAFVSLRTNVTIAVAAACSLASIALASETYGLIIALGHAFERAEPQQVT
jgi:hypothetical protein